jgi:hypothetical protein
VIQDDIGQRAFERPRVPERREEARARCLGEQPGLATAVALNGVEVRGRVSSADGQARDQLVNADLVEHHHAAPPA